MNLHLIGIMEGEEGEERLLLAPSAAEGPAVHRTPPSEGNYLAPDVSEVEKPCYRVMGSRGC